MNKAFKWSLIGILILVLGWGIVYQGFWRWVVCREEVQYGRSLQITRKTGDPASSNGYAETDKNQQGVIEQMRGPGRHFFNPWAYHVDEVEDILVEPGQIRYVTNKLGESLPNDQFIAGPGQQGTLLRVLTPGVWRINPHGQKVSNPNPARIIEPGYVGVQTLRQGENKGIQDVVLGPGFYHLNESLVQIDRVEIGYREWTMRTEYEKVRVKRNDSVIVMERPRIGTGISFPLADGKTMFLDITVIWGVLSKNAPRMIRDYGTMEMVQAKIIEPQVISICKNLGSDYTTMEFIKAKSREQFQNEFTERLMTMATEKGISVQVALVRRFHPDPLILQTIQTTLLAEEEKETLATERERDMVAARLEQAEREVEIAVADFNAETSKLVQAENELGNKFAAEIREGARRQAAAHLRKAAELDGQARRIGGQAVADVSLAERKAEAEGTRLRIQAYGDASIYNFATFAGSLPEDLAVNYRYAGEGTFWTTASDAQDTAARVILRDQQK